MDIEQEASKEAPQKKPHNKPLSLAFTIVIALGLILLGVGVGWWRRGQSDNSLTQTQQSQIADLQSQLATAKKNLTAKASQQNSSSNTNTQITSTEPSQATIDNITAAVTSGNTAALQGYMASSVAVIIAASDGIGTRTPAQATSDVSSYLKSASTPWNFSLPAATLSVWQSGFYKHYFPSGALVGESANKMVVSFLFGAGGKISTVFMAQNADLL